MSGTWSTGRDGGGSAGARRRLALALVGGALVVGLIVVSRRVVEPLHARGWWPGATALIGSLAAVADQPARMLLHRLAPGAMAFSGRAALALAFVLYTGMTFGFLLLGSMRVSRLGGPGHRRGVSSGDEVAAGVPSPSRRRFMGSAVQQVTGLAVAGGIGYASVVRPRVLKVTRNAFPLRGLPRELSGLRVVQVTDVHHGPWLTTGDLRRIVATANALRPDLVVLTGDYVLHQRVYAEPVVEVLSGLKARIGVVATLGNHDWYESAEALADLFPRAGIPMLDNTRLFVRPDRTLARDADRGLCVAGVGDLWHDRQLYDAALGGVPEAMPRLLLSHNPDVAEDTAFLRSRHRVDLMISGHTHGGQVKLPGVGAMVTYSSFGQKYLHGLVHGPACPVFVCAGVGMSKMPVRIGVPPEIAVFDFVAG